jgi:hypothetical protein
MANLRKADRRDKIMERITALAAVHKTKNTGTNPKEDNGTGNNGQGTSPMKKIFRLGSKSSFKLLKRGSDLSAGGGGLGGGGEGGGRGGGANGKGRGGRGGGGGREEYREESRQSLMPKIKTSDGGERGAGGGDGGGGLQTGGRGRKGSERSGYDDSSCRCLEDGGEEVGEYLDLPVEFTLDMNRLSPTPSGAGSPLSNSTSATPSPPARRVIKPMSCRITFEDEGFVL